MTHDCERCAHRLICEWCVENSTFRMPENDGKCGMYLPQEKSRPSEEGIKRCRTMRIKAVIALIAYAAAMFIAPFAGRVIYGFPVWVAVWISCLIGWWCMTGSQFALIQALGEKIREGEEES